MRIGIDVGGTKIEIAALSDDGSLQIRERVPSPQNDYQSTIRCIKDLVESVEARLSRTCSVGIGIPGTLSRRTNTVKNANSTWLNGKPLLSDLETSLHRDVRIANDANCFALSEAIDGAGAGHHSVFGVILGTGCGAGYIVSGKIMDGPNQITGEWGHNPLPWQTARELDSARRCYCGKTNCIETWLSGPGLERTHHEHQDSARLSAIQVAEQAKDGDPHAIASLRLYLVQLAKSLTTVINLLDPKIIVFGGGLSNIEEIYKDVPTLVGDYIFSDAVETHFHRNHFGDSSGVRGAAWLWDSPAPE